ncbi:transcriptional regulator CsgD [Leminorella grimontii]|uniref:Transcriptional regulator CsgD n=1 Tax=Leminorella grimontii TaxID=82981 RepID=A0AAV5N3Z8_9GAMM|nr:biofilm master transcriptional regulator CsgD [Leminorella grimontii]KFC95179.1 transcriptional regulator [Leminorella grimontii ATCC 33999 = DSM 5078]GKX56223.1 transcriptional regulator CsgD [Leminorella grimontii]GKX60403.1 transcriptional regulator CsgD [Leminorella grimontii]VFS60942.1 CsgBAC operon transcriptional regulatory protein [Leminorella grimontii]
MNNEVNNLLLLVTQPSLLATALLHQLETSFSVHVRLQNSDKPFDEFPPQAGTRFILFDLLGLDKKRTLYWQEAFNRQRANIKILLLNTPENYRIEEIERWPHVYAVFYLSTDRSKLLEGINSVMEGEYYFSQQLTSSLIERSRRYHFNHGDITSGLTQREKEILTKLSMGASNVEIANLLFISENTVKTHLYNLFRKISVKNRTQAASWANEHLRR